jgi:hypothetical protein
MPAVIAANFARLRVELGAAAEPAQFGPLDPTVELTLSGPPPGGASVGSGGL